MYETQTGGKGAPPRQPPKAPPVADWASSYDPQEITLEVETDEGTEVVTIPFDFDDFTDEETQRVAALIDGEVDVAKTMSAFLFVASARQINLTDEAFLSFAVNLAPLWDNDPSILKVV